MAGICEGRVVIITGAGQGIGRAHAHAFANEGAKVVVNDLGGADGKAGDVVDEIKEAGGEAIAHGADVASWEETGDLVQTAIDEFGKLDTIVCNAGVLRDGMFFKMSPDAWDTVMDVHLKGHFNVARHAAEYWREQKKEGNDIQGRIINTSSAAGLQGNIGQANYGAAKAGIACLTLIQAAELQRYGVTANAIAPMARTEMTEGLFEMDAEEDFDEFDPANISPIVVWLGSDDSADVSGRVFEVAGDWIAPADGWRTGPKKTNNRKRWEPSKIGSAVREVLDEVEEPQKVYGT
jgi:NAD(P)-dependent dehydrogenase (short-subunit alcohol dehydrogenase family)